MWQQWSCGILPVLADAAIKGVIVLLLAWILALCMKRKSAAGRHAVWLTAMGCLLSLPLLSAALPSLHVLPSWCDLSVVSAPEELALSTEPVRKTDSNLTRPVERPDLAAPSPGTPEDPPMDNAIAFPPANRATDWPTVDPSNAATPPGVLYEPPPETPVPNTPETSRPNVPVASAVAGEPRTTRSVLSRLIPWFAAVWLAGLVTLVGRLLLASMSTWWAVSKAKRCEDASCLQLLRETAATLGLRRTVTLIESDRCSIPLVIGMLRPRVILPPQFCGWPDDRRRVVMLHELAHIMRWDCLTKVFGQLVCAIHWFNPLVWLAYRRTLIEAEQACDDVVLGRGSDPHDYAEHLLEIASDRRSRRLAAVTGFAMARPSSLEGRLLAILDSGRSRRGLTVLGILLLFGLLAGATAVIAPMRADDGAGPYVISEFGGGTPDRNIELVTSVRQRDSGEHLWSLVYRNRGSFSMGSDRQSCVIGDINVAIPDRNGTVYVLTQGGDLAETKLSFADLEEIRTHKPRFYDHPLWKSQIVPLLECEEKASTVDPDETTEVAVSQKGTADDIDGDRNWSKPVNGLRGRLVPRWKDGDLQVAVLLENVGSEDIVLPRCDGESIDINRRCGQPLELQLYGEHALLALDTTAGMPSDGLNLVQMSNLQSRARRDGNGFLLKTLKPKETYTATHVVGKTLGDGVTLTLPRLEDSSAATLGGTYDSSICASTIHRITGQITWLGELKLPAVPLHEQLLLKSRDENASTIEDPRPAPPERVMVCYRCRIVAEESIPNEEDKRVTDEVGDWFFVETNLGTPCSTVVTAGNSQVATINATPVRDSGGKPQMEDIIIRCRLSDLNAWLENLERHVSAVQAAGTVTTERSAWGSDLTTATTPNASTPPHWVAVRRHGHENKSNGYQGNVVVWLDARVVSQPVEQTEPDSASWGEPVEGVQVGLRAEKLDWKTGEAPRFTTEVRKGERRITFGWGDAVCELEFDGEWYYVAIDDHPVDRITLDESWSQKENHAKLPLSVGKHTIRVAITGPVDGKSVRAVSNPIEITISDAQPRAADDSKRMLTIGELASERAAPDLGQLAERSKPGHAGADSTEAFYDVLKLREVGNADAIPVLQQILVDHLESGCIHGFAAAQALFCIGTQEAHQFLSKHLLTGQYRAGQAIAYTFHWDMAEPQRSRFIDQYLLKSVSNDMLVELQQQPTAPDSKGQLDLVVTLRNASQRPFHVMDRNTYLGKMLFFRTPGGQTARSGVITRYYHGRNAGVDYEQGPGEWIELKPGRTHQYAITINVKSATEIRARDRSVSEDSVVLLESRDVRWEIGKPERYEVIAMFEAAPLSDLQKKQVQFDNAWSGRAVSKPIQVEIPAPTPTSAKWSEPLNGLRVRVTVPENAEYRKGQPLPLTVEIQNVTSGVIPFDSLFPHGRIKVTASQGKWLGSPWFEIAVSPWEGSTAGLAPQAVLKWQVRFDRLRLSKPVAAGSTVHFQYSVPTEVEEPGSLPQTSYSPPVAIKLIDVPPAALTSETLPERWTADMDLVYREFAGLGGPERRVHVDGRGHVTLVDCSGFGRIEATLPQTRLDALASRLRRMKVWELSDFRPPAGPLDAGEIRFSLASGGTSLTGNYSLLLTREEQVLAALRSEMMALIDAALANSAEESKRKASDEQIKATAAEIRRKLPDGGKKMWEALAALVKPDITVAQMKVVLPPAAPKTDDDPREAMVFDGASFTIWYPLDAQFGVEASGIARGKAPEQMVLSAAPRIKALKDLPRVRAGPANAGFERKYPGSWLSIQEAVNRWSAFAVACEAMEEPNDATNAHPVPGSAVKWHQFRWDVALGGGRGVGGQRVLNYRVWNTGQRHEGPIAKGDHVIWMGINPSPDYYYGLKALPDTPENREAVRAAFAKRQPSAVKYVAFPEHADAQKAAERVALLKRNLDTFRFVFRAARQPKQPARFVALRVAEGEDSSGWEKPAIQITRQQATRIIDHLANEGLFFRRAGNVIQDAGFEPDTATHTIWLIDDENKPQAILVGGIQFNKDDRIAALRDVLEGPARDTMDQLLARSSAGDLTADTPDLPDWAQALTKALAGWEVVHCDRDATVSVESRRGYRMALRKAESGLSESGQVQGQQSPRPGVEAPRPVTSPQFVTHVELVLFPATVNLPEGLAERIPWQKLGQTWHAQAVDMGEGMGFRWFARTTLYWQDWLREKLNLTGGDDPLALLAEGLFVEDQGRMTANSVMGRLKLAGEQAVPAIEAAIKRHPSEDAWKAVHALGYIQGDRATAALKSLYASDNERVSQAAAYALIHEPYRKAAREQYLDMLRRQTYVYQAAAACVEFQWREAIPLLQAVCDKPTDWGNYRDAFKARRTLEGKPITQAIEDAQAAIIETAYRPLPTDKQTIARAKGVLLDSADTEVVRIAAIGLATFDTKANKEQVQRVQQAGRDILEKLPADDTKNLLKTLVGGMKAHGQDEGYWRDFADLLDWLDAAETPAPNSRSKSD